MLGTPAFMAPEQALGQFDEIDGQTDLWAVGATLFTLLSGHLVHEAETAPQLLLRAASSPARSLASVVPDIPSPIGALVDKALAFDKSSRWQGAVAMRDALRDAYASAFGQPLTREVLVAHVQQTEATNSPPAGDHKSDRPARPVYAATELSATKPERPAVKPLQATVPLATRALQEASRAPRSEEEVAKPDPPAPAADPLAASDLATASPAPLASPEAAGGARRSLVPVVIAVALVLGLGIGIAVMLAGR